MEPSEIKFSELNVPGKLGVHLNCVFVIKSILQIWTLETICFGQEKIPLSDIHCKYNEQRFRLINLAKPVRARSGQFNFLIFLRNGKSKYLTRSMTSLQFANDIENVTKQ